MVENKLDKAIEFVKESIHDLEMDIKYEEDEETEYLVDSLEDLLAFVEKNRK